MATLYGNKCKTDLDLTKKVWNY